VAGQHQAFLGNVVGHRATRILDEAHADIETVRVQRRRRHHRLDRIRKMIVQAGLRVAIDLAEPQHDADLFGLNDKEPGQAPQGYGDEDDEDDALATQSTWQDRPQPILAAAEKLLEIGCIGSRRLRSGAPGPLGARTPRPAATLITPRHTHTLSWRPPPPR